METLKNADLCIKRSTREKKPVTMDTIIILA
jgi:hypothetical protein